MNISIPSKRELEVTNRRNLKYPLAIAEKDYFLALVSKIIYNSSLRNKLVFKGGTALHHCYLDQMRFSEDLDFTSLSKNINIKEIKEVIEENDFLRVKKEHTSKATIKLEKLSYSGPLEQSNSLKLEVDFLQNVVLPARDLKYRNVWSVDTSVRVMDIREITAEKVRATSDRARYRDFYDLFQIFKDFEVSLKEVVKIIKQKEIRKPISQNSILNNWEVAKQDKVKESQEIYYSQEVSDADIKEMIKKLKIGVIEQ